MRDDGDWRCFAEHIGVFFGLRDEAAKTSRLRRLRAALPSPRVLRVLRAVRLLTAHAPLI
jgi:hypothetical protein